MSDSIPLEPGKYFHIYNRGNNRESIFLEERNYLHFLRLYQKYILPVCDTFAYCLMKNHFHLLVRIKENQTCQVSENLAGLPASRQFSNFFNSYAKAINLSYQRTGSLFEKPFGRIEIDSECYFARLIHYIHFNPQKHGFIDDFRNYPFSSYQAILSTKPTHLCREEVLSWFQGRAEFVGLHEVLCDENDLSHLVEGDFD
jgi:REP element-mobilizing transposase RayT